MNIWLPQVLVVVLLPLEVQCPQGRNYTGVLLVPGAQRSFPASGGSALLIVGSGKASLGG